MEPQGKELSMKSLMDRNPLWRTSWWKILPDDTPQWLH